MKYSTDKPIEKQEDDLLGRASFSNQLGKAIYGYEEESSLVIGLFGEWGTGKTSIINMVENEILRLSSNGNKEPFIIRFSPWNYTDKDNLISLFFESLQTKLKDFDTKKIYNSVRKALCDYANALDVLSYIPGVSPKVVEIIKAIAKGQGEWLEDTPDLDKSRKILEEELIKINRKIIVIIDDIDRLTNIQIRDIFQLVKQVADFPNVIYILVMDRNVVQSALTAVHEIDDGNEYLEKIIQIPLEIPQLSKEKLNNIFLNQLEAILKNTSIEVKIDNSYWNNIFANCISPYINNLRDVNRILNTFQFKYGVLQQETSFEDMIAITTLEVMEPKLYKWISTNKDTVCGGGFKRILETFNNKKIDYRVLYSNEFKKMELNPDITIKCISTIFPQFSRDVNEHIYFESNNSDLLKNMRIANKERFDIYFLCDLSDIKVSRNMINSWIFELEKKQLELVFNKINKNGEIEYFLNEIESLVGEIPYNRLSLIASVLIILNGKLYTKSSNNILVISAVDKINIIIERILDRLTTDDEKYQTLYLSLLNINQENIGAFSKLLISIGKSHGRFVENSESIENKIINLDYLQKIEKKYIEKVEFITSSVSISEINEFRAVFFLWKYIDERGLSNYVGELLNSEIDKLKFISTLACRWTGTTPGWSYYSNDYEKFISKKDIYDSIMNIDKNMLREFTELEQIKLASFVCNYDKGEFDHASEDEARELVKRWELEARIYNSNIK